MYLPHQFEESDPNTIRAVIRAAPFATLVTVDSSGEPFINHLPILDDDRNTDTLKLFGHMARANPQWRSLQSGARAVAIFHGPHSYITPTWYTESFVPTWSYAVVHARGAMRVIEEFESLDEILSRSVQRFEASQPQPFAYALPLDLRREKLRSIVGFEMKVEHVEAKFKISQNRSVADREGAMRGLATRSDEGSAGVLALMTRKYSAPT